MHGIVARDPDDAISPISIAPDAPDSPFHGIPAELSAGLDTVRLAADILVGAGDSGDVVRRAGPHFVEHRPAWTVTHGRTPPPVRDGSDGAEAESAGELASAGEPGQVRAVHVPRGDAGEVPGMFFFASLPDGSLHWRHISPIPVQHSGPYVETRGFFFFFFLGFFLFRNVCVCVCV
jgi:hypothetical protein